MNVALDLDEQIPSREKVPSPADYKDLNFDDLKRITNYLTRNSIPRNITIQEVQEILAAYSDLLNKSLHNLNVLRSLAGDGPYEIPVEGGESND